ncbi:protein translocase subunit SecD [Denitrobacterium detoxificans]|jgi:SecD/SecF fusion protein|uniref:protein translocase subunit SecD n=1 Tax=Denitrobacterium detoxificans TaxID=79604 RepID=UPI0026EEC1DA|nr:protein translocase subunit SecD [Denitrobacterium detoxificans]MBE6466232.1 protein translocase subunit SecD [Denitrobacterium detoxificans]
MAESNTKKRKHVSGNNRRNVWLLILLTLLVVGSVFMFTPPQEKINQGLDIQGGLSVVLTANSTDGDSVSQEDMEVSRDIIESRVNALGASEATVQIQGNNQILVQIPGISDTQDALDTIGRTGNLEFARLDSFTDEEVQQKIDSGNLTTSTTITDDYGNSLPSEGGTQLTVEEGTYTPIVTGANIQSVTIDKQSEGSPYYAVNITLDAEGTQAFAEASADLVDDHGKIVIILDGVVNSAPAVQSEITTGQVSITGNYSQDEAKALKTVLESGSLPVSFTYAQSQTVGPTLGQDALASGVLVALAGILLVMLYLLFFYHGLGMITAAAIAVFSVLYLGLLATLSHFGLFSLSLSGVAGIVLTIGMAADSSILTLERFREEIRFGRSVRAASITGVRHGILTSIDADLVSLVTALSLFFLASSGVKGFGLTLALGIMCDIVMMLIFKAPLIRLLAPHAIAKHPGFWGVSDCQAAASVYKELSEAEGETVETSVSLEAINSADNETYATRKGGERGTVAAKAASKVKGRFIKHDINFLGYRKVFLTIAAVVMVLSAVIIGVRGLNLGIEFVGGTSITFTDTGSVTTDQMRSAFADAGESDAVIQTTTNNGEAGFIVRTTNADAAESAGEATAVANGLGLSSSNFQVSTIGPDWGASVIQSMFIALIVSFILIIAYIALRFRQYKMGVTAIVALVHDILLVVGIYALVGREINPNVIAALLTILGYSLYDTVVVFHRISDNMEHSEVPCTFMTMANHSMNQVFIRSINTTLTSIIPVFAMLLFGSETLQDFAFAMVIGLLAGAYSSIAIACPLFAIWKSREEKNVNLTKKYGNEVGRFATSRGSLTYAAPEKEAEAAKPAVAVAEKEAAAQPKQQEQAEQKSAAQIAKEKRAAARKQAKKKKTHEAAQPEIRIVDREKFEEASEEAAKHTSEGTEE